MGLVKVDGNSCRYSGLSEPNYSLLVNFFEILCVRVFDCTNVYALCVCTYAYSESEEGLGSLGTGVTDTVSCGC